MTPAQKALILKWKFLPEPLYLALLRSAGIQCRVVRRDGKSYMVTQDYCPDRVNVSVVRGYVSNISYG